MVARLCQQRATAANLPVDPTAIVAAVSAVLSPPPLPPQFSANQNECAVAFLTGLLDSVELEPGHITSYQEEGACQMCGAVYRQVASQPLMTIHQQFLSHPPQATHWHHHWQTVPIPDQRRPVFLPPLVRAGRAAVPPNHWTLTCSRGDPNRHCTDQGVPSHLVPTQGGILYQCI